MGQLGGGSVTLYALTGSDQQVKTGSGFYRGLSVRETASAAASIVLYDNTAASGTIIETVALAAGESVRIWFDDEGIPFTNGVYADVTGTIQGSIRIR